MDKKIIEIVRDFKQAIEDQGIKVSKLVLYGSYAVNTQRNDSDIDLVVISKDFNRKNLMKRIDILANAVCRVFEPIEAVAFTPGEWAREESLICQFAKRNGISVPV